MSAREGRVAAGARAGRERRGRRRTPGADPTAFRGLPSRRDAPIRLVRWDQEACTVRRVFATEVGAWLGPGGNVWIDVAAPSAADLAELRRLLGLHGLATSVLAHDATPHPHHVAWRRSEALVLVGTAGEGRLEQVSVVLGDGWVLSIHECESDRFDVVRERLTRADDPLRAGGASLLAATLCLALVDGLFEPVDALRDTLEELEDEAIEERVVDYDKLHRLRRHFDRMRPIDALPMAIGRALWAGSTLWDRDARVVLALAEETAHHLQALLEGAKGSAISLADLQISILQARSNAGIAFLTTVSTIFLPITFLTGVWAMRFEYMPEVGWRWGYPMALTTIAFSGLLLIAFIRRQPWWREMRASWGAQERPRPQPEPWGRDRDGA